MTRFIQLHEYLSETVEKIISYICIYLCSTSFIPGDKEPSDFQWLIPNYRKEQMGLCVLFKDWASNYLPGVVLQHTYLCIMFSHHLAKPISCDISTGKRQMTLPLLCVEHCEDGFPLLITPKDLDDFKIVEMWIILKEYIQAAWGMLWPFLYILMVADCEHSTCATSQILYQCSMGLTLLLVNHMFILSSIFLCNFVSWFLCNERSWKYI